jgi:ATP-dependent protease ClpP protease subunit
MKFIYKATQEHNDKNINKHIVKSNDQEEPETTENKGIYREYNHIYFFSEIDRETVGILIQLLREAEEYCIITALRLRIIEIPIYVHLYSDGGYICAAFAVIDIIRSSKVPVYSIIEGSVASAGTLISIVCKKRYIRPTAYMLIHQLSSELWGKMSEITDEYKNLSGIMTKLEDLYKEYTNLSEKKLNKLLKHDLLLNAEKAIKYGLVDEIFI